MLSTRTLLKESITPYDILKYHNQDIPVYDFKSNKARPIDIQESQKYQCC